MVHHRNSNVSGMHNPTAPPPTVETKLLTAKETAENLAIDQRTLRRWTAAGRITAVRFCKTVTRYRPEDVAAFIASNMAPAGTEAK